MSVCGVPKEQEPSQSDKPEDDRCTEGRWAAKDAGSVLLYCVSALIWDFCSKDAWTWDSEMTG